MNDEPEFEEQLAALNGRMTAAEKNQWLQAIYKQYSDRATKDNDRIWSVTGIFIPLSLAGLSSTKDITHPGIVLLAIGSIALILFWYIICEKHRLFQEKSTRIVQAIEKHIGLDLDVVYLYKFTNYANNLALRKSLKQLRLFITLIVIAIWLLTVLITFI